ncbi:MAG: hypothetical protein Q7K39_03090 [Candidatus Magasanikbacteria bacterium]|nr:hypothetical protein [Candidatus Magasanikbacteria bacterium]
MILIFPKKLVILATAGAVVLAFLGLGVGGASAKIKPLELSETEIIMGVGERRELLADSGTGLTVWSNSKAVKATMNGARRIGLIAVQEGVAKVTVCSQDVYCAFAYVTVSKKTTKRALPATEPIAKKIESEVARANVAPANKSKIVNNKKIITPPVSPVTANKAKALKLSEIDVVVAKYKSEDIFVNSSGTFTAVSDSEVARAAVNGNRVTIYGAELGETSLKICDNLAVCAYVHVSVKRPISGVLTVSQKNVSMETDSTFWLVTENGAGVTVKSSSSVVKTKVVDNLILLTTKRSTGNAILRICAEYTNCLLVQVTVKKSVTAPEVRGSFKTVTLDIDQSVDVPFPSDFALSYYQSESPTNLWTADLEIKRDNFTITGKGAGSVIFKLCPVNPDYACGTIGVNVSHKLYCDSSAGNVQLTSPSLTLTNGVTADVTASTCQGLTAISDDTTVARTAVNGYRVTLYPFRVGSTKVRVCDASGACAPLLVTVVRAE